MKLYRLTEKELIEIAKDITNNLYGKCLDYFEIEEIVKRSALHYLKEIDIDEAANKWRSETTGTDGNANPIFDNQKFSEYLEGLK